MTQLVRLILWYQFPKAIFIDILEGKYFKILYTAHILQIKSFV